MNTREGFDTLIPSSLGIVTLSLGLSCFSCDCDWWMRANQGFFLVHWEWSACFSFSLVGMLVSEQG